MPGGKIIFNVNRLERHGVKNYPFGVDNECEIISGERLTDKDDPQITFRAKKPLTLLVIHNGKETVYESTPL